MSGSLQALNIKCQVIYYFHQWKQVTFRLWSQEVFKYRKRVFTKSVSKGTKQSMLEQTIVLVAGVWVGVGRRLRQEGQVTFMDLCVTHLKKNREILSTFQDCHSHSFNKCLLMPTLCQGLFQAPEYSPEDRKGLYHYEVYIHL